MSPRPSKDIERADIAKSHVDNVEVVANADRPNARKEAPAYVASLTPEEREQAEKALVRRIDLRLLPMIIIMYILNYLDRNNIVSRTPIARTTQSHNVQASARLAGLEEDLGLVGNQYLVRRSSLYDMRGIAHDSDRPVSVSCLLVTC